MVPSGYVVLVTVWQGHWSVIHNPTGGCATISWVGFFLYDYFGGETMDD